MFSDLNVATEVHERLLAVRGMLGNSVASIKGSGSEEEYNAYRKLVGDALGTLIIEGLTPIEAASQARSRRQTLVPDETKALFGGLAAAETRAIFDGGRAFENAYPIKSSKSKPCN